MRRRADAVIGRLVERFHSKKVWAKDFWHLISRLLRKALSHTTAIFLNMQQCNPPLQLEALII